MKQVNVAVQSGEKSQKFQEVSLPLELGRQRQDEPDWLRLQNLGSLHRIAIAPLRATGVPRSAIRVELDGEGIRVTNIHGRSSFVVMPELSTVGPGEQVTSSDFISVMITDEIEVSIQLIDETDSGESSLAIRTLEGSQELPDVGENDGKLADLRDNRTEESRIQVAVNLVRQALAVVHKAAGSDEYFQAAVRSAATMIELDRAYVILYKRFHLARSRKVLVQNQDNRTDVRQRGPRGTAYRKRAASSTRLVDQEDRDLRTDDVHAYDGFFDDGARSRGCSAHVG